MELVFTRSSSLAEWKLARRTASVATVSDSVATDPRMHALVAPYAATTRASLEVAISVGSTSAKRTGKIDFFMSHLLLGFTP